MPASHRRCVQVYADKVPPGLHPTPRGNFCKGSCGLQTKDGDQTGGGRDPGRKQESEEAVREKGVDWHNQLRGD